MVTIIGAGPAGMMAAVAVTLKGVDCVLLEKNDKPGKKLYITGKGRCNLTNNTDKKGLISHTMSNPKFLYSAFSKMDSKSLMEFFESRGTPLKTERGNRVFPVSDKAVDITKTLMKYIRNAKFNINVNDIKYKDTEFFVNGEYKSKALIIATGGLSYPSTGSTGDGYEFAKHLGHTCTPLSPSLAPIILKETWIRDLSGLSLKNIRLKLLYKNSIIYEEIGEMLFTHHGISGPLVLTASSYIKDINDHEIIIDLKPGLDTKQLDTRLVREFSQNPNKNIINTLKSLLPEKLTGIVLKYAEIKNDTISSNITKTDRERLVNTLKSLKLIPRTLAGFSEAVITKGGININEINPGTMMSKLLPGLFFAGEILDVDALTGGYNLQIAFSTGYLAGVSAVKFISTTCFNLKHVTYCNNS